MSDGMRYDRAIIETLRDELRVNFGKLTAAGDEMTSAKDQMAAAWTGDSLTGFMGTYDNWRKEYDGHDGSSGAVHKLNEIAKLVESALNEALGADQKIGDGFGNF
ncbi:MAG: family type secretion target [Nocardia sp.]|uniref:WXG100 family type VII secretion target n=1 Tax=Nocardia sp. TaxID=1821 RepID=UPI002627A5A0|nr:hypothetical protein [Nocardia sp.]MCU1643407.1 family type secretion target [Nocardia sp.]